MTTTTPTREVALDLARSATQGRLAAGAQILGPATSVFWHGGEFGAGEEWMIRFVTTTDGYPALRDHLVDAHPWASPEITAVTFAEATPAYLEWVRRTVAGA